MAMDVTLRQLRAYVAVLESASFSEAAKAMHLSQAALSGLIKELETRVGVRLLDRTTRKVSVSAVGETCSRSSRRRWRGPSCTRGCRRASRSRWRSFWAASG
jgi:DNA-binding transcriptional LysR family regulator